MNGGKWMGDGDDGDDGTVKAVDGGMGECVDGDRNS